MPQIRAENLRAVVRAIVSAAGSEGEEPGLVADNLVYANLTGHDSHGVGMLARYIRAVGTGELVPNAHVRVVTDHGPVLVLDGNAGYGQVVGAEAMALGIERARAHGVCVLAIRNSFHLCRIGAWGEQCARAGMVSMHHVNGVGHHGIVAPFRGADARYSTNPYCCVLPGTDDNPEIMLDFATSRIAHGKVRVARNKGERVAEDVLLDKAGTPTTDPHALFDGGALRPFGDYKGYGLALVNELVAGVLTGGGGCRPETDHEHDTIINNMLSVIIDPTRLVSAAFYRSELDATLAHVKASPPMDADAPVLAPGDPERATLVLRERDGIPLDEESWRELVEAGVSTGIARERIEALAGFGAAGAAAGVGR
jgi:uncharacterized oxidoreductase